MFHQARKQLLRSGATLSVIALLGGCSYFSEKAHQIGDMMPTYGEPCTSGWSCFGGNKQQQPAGAQQAQQPRYSPQGNAQPQQANPYGVPQQQQMGAPQPQQQGYPAQAPQQYQQQAPQQQAQPGQNQPPPDSRYGGFAPEGLPAPAPLNPSIAPPKGATPGVNWPPPPPEFGDAPPEMSGIGVGTAPNVPADQGLPPSPGLPPGVDPNEQWPPPPPGGGAFPEPPEELLELKYQGTVLE